MPKGAKFKNGTQKTILSTAGQLLTTPEILFATAATLLSGAATLLSTVGVLFVSPGELFVSPVILFVSPATLYVSAGELLLGAVILFAKETKIWLAYCNTKIDHDFNSSSAISIISKSPTIPAFSLTIFIYSFSFLTLPVALTILAKSR